MSLAIKDGFSGGFFLPYIVSGTATNPNTTERWSVVAPQDVQTARALWWFLVRSWGSFAAGQRKRARYIDPYRQVSFVPENDSVESIFDIQEGGQRLGKLYMPLLLKEDEAFDSKVRLLYYLYIVKFAYTFEPSDNKTRDRWRNWRSHWNKPLDLASNSRDVIWLELPPDAPEPQLAIVFHTPFPPGRVTVFFEGFWQQDQSDPVGGFYAVLGDWITSHSPISSEGKDT
ncbi:MAG: hypothetical protein AB1776_08830 [Bacillota bacterium]